MTKPTPLPTASALLNDLQARGLLYQSTQGLAEHLAKPRTLYCGFDPTADSLHIGSLVPLLALRRFQQAGHRIIVLMGGATGMIGDPSFKATERKLLDEDTLRSNVAAIQTQIEPLFEAGTKVVDNYAWTKDMGVLEFLRDIGKHFSVNQLIARDSVKSRLDREGEGISFTEFAYSLLQGFDFYELNRTEKCTLQIGGSDQWGNMTAGTELIRKKGNGEAHVMTLPLVTKADGTKFGKSESGTIWLDSAKTSPYAFYQFWLNTADADIEKFLGYFSFRTMAEIKTLMAEHAINPGARIPHKALAEELTQMLHGAGALEGAQRIADALFGGSSHLRETDYQQLALDGLPAHATKDESMHIVDALILTGLAESKREAREFISKGILVNWAPMHDDTYILAKEKAIYGKYHLLRRGKKNFALLVMA